MKTPEQMAEEYADQFIFGGEYRHIVKRGFKDAFIAGYQAVSLNSEAVQAATPQWISVEDRLPEVGKKILWYHEPGGEFSVGLLHHEVEQPFFTHWMPLPAPPEEEK